jgi:hypothetical protein
LVLAQPHDIRYFLVEEAWLRRVTPKLAATSVPLVAEEAIWPPLREMVYGVSLAMGVLAVELPDASRTS